MTVFPQVWLAEKRKCSSLIVDTGGLPFEGDSHDPVLSLSMRLRSSVNYSFSWREGRRVATLGRKPPFFVQMF
ncbi:hypothetical protein FOPE_06059 [Fonsecaea pedrosoi]|nr:hypothetical protein FOPE_06059 [Fonsecaea pedrosoi]